MSNGLCKYSRHLSPLIENYISNLNPKNDLKVETHLKWLLWPISARSPHLGWLWFWKFLSLNDSPQVTLFTDSSEISCPEAMLVLVYPRCVYSMTQRLGFSSFLGRQAVLPHSQPPHACHQVSTCPSLLSLLLLSSFSRHMLMFLLSRCMNAYSWRVHIRSTSPFV